MVRGRWRRWLMVGFGVLCLVITPVAVANGDTFGAVFIGAFGAMLLVVGGTRPAPEGSRQGMERGSLEVRGGRRLHGLLIAASPRRVLRTRIAVALFALIGVLLLVAGNWLVGGLCVVLFGGVGLASARTLGPSLLAPEGLALAGGRVFVPWDAIAEVDRVEYRGSERLDITVADRSRVEAGPVVQLLMPLQRVLGADLSLPLGLLDADPDLVTDTVLRALEHPEDRSAL